MSYVKTNVDKSTLLSNQVQEQLDPTHGTKLSALIMDLTPYLDGNEIEVRVPRFSGLSMQNVVNGAGSEQTVTSGLVGAADTLVLDQFKEVPEYITAIQKIQDAVGAEAAFMAIAPMRYAEGLENAIYSALSASTAKDFNTSADTSATPATELVISIEDFAKAKKEMDKAGVPLAQRYAVVNADLMEVIAMFPEFQDASKSLSPEALRLGVVSQIKGFQIVQYDGSAASTSKKVVCFHKTGCAFAWQKKLEYIKEVSERKANIFLSLRGLHGVKILDKDQGRNINITALNGTKP